MSDDATPRPRSGGSAGAAAGTTPQPPPADNAAAEIEQLKKQLAQANEDIQNLNLQLSDADDELLALRSAAESAGAAPQKVVVTRNAAGEIS